MNEIQRSHDDEIDLIQVFKSLWNGKWNIILITIAITLGGIAYNFQSGEKYTVSMPIQNGKGSVFIEFKSINEVLKENDLLLSEENLNGYLVNSSTIFEMFVNEFNDYEEMIKTLSNNNTIKNLIKDLDTIDQRKSLIGYAKSFQMSQPMINETNSKLVSTFSYTWTDVDEGSNLSEEALNLTLLNVKATLINDINVLASSIDMKNLRELDKLQTELDIIKNQHYLNNSRRIYYLEEQSSMAKELNISKNGLPNALIQSQIRSLSLESQDNSVSVDMVSSDFPYYLRGYIAIDKEIEIIKNRSPQKELLFIPGYDEINKKILLLKNDKSSNQLRNFIKAIKNNNTDDWINMNLAFADSKSNSNPRLIIIFSILFGIAIGIIYTFISNAIRLHNEQINKV